MKCIQCAFIILIFIACNAGKSSTCSVNGDCAKDQICLNKVCTKVKIKTECDEYRPCPSPYTCIDTVCKEPAIQCASDAQCQPPTTVCEANACIPGCVQNPTLCQNDQTCNILTGRCGNDTQQSHCSSGQDCPMPTGCNNGSCGICTEDNHCDSSAGAKCNTLTGECYLSDDQCTSQETCNPSNCAIDEECNKPFEICEDNICAKSCAVENGIVCTLPESCNVKTGRCEEMQTKQIGETCQSDHECISLQCLQFPLGGQDYSICSKVCTQSSDCDPHYVCTYLDGISFCLSEVLFGNIQFYEDPGSFCSQDLNQCHSGYCQIEQQTCLETCSSPNQCGSYGGQCTSMHIQGAKRTQGFCTANPGKEKGEACESDSQCSSGVCDLVVKKCTDLCCTAQDCGTGESCLPIEVDVRESAASGPQIYKDMVKACIKKLGTGSIALGSACEQPSDCVSDICSPSDPSESDSETLCSTTCCSDADCNFFGDDLGICRAFKSPVPGKVFGVCTAR